MIMGNYGSCSDLQCFQHQMHPGKNLGESTLWGQGSLLFQFGERREETPNKKQREHLPGTVLWKMMLPTKFLQMPLGANKSVDQNSQLSYEATHWERGQFIDRWSPDFFRLLLSNCLNWNIYCDDHSSSIIAVQIWIISYTFHITSLHGKIWTQ